MISSHYTNGENEFKASPEWRASTLGRTRKADLVIVWTLAGIVLGAGG